MWTARRWPATLPAGVVVLKAAPHSPTISPAVAPQSLAVSRLRAWALAADGLKNAIVGGLIMRVGKVQKFPFWTVAAPTPWGAIQALAVPALWTGAVARGKVLA